MVTLSEYLNALDSDAQLKAAHDADPQGTMQEYGLSEQEIKAALSGDEASINKASGFEDASGPAIQAIHHTSLNDE